MMKLLKVNHIKISHICLLSITTAIISSMSSRPMIAQDCKLESETLEEGCEHTNAGTSISAPTQPNAELERFSEVGIDGFAISVDGQKVTQSGKITALRADTSQTKAQTVPAKVRLQDIEIAKANMSVQFDGLDAQPRLFTTPSGKMGAGGKITISNEMNYPAFITRGEIRLIDVDAIGGAKTIEVIAMDPNTEREVIIPDTGNVSYVYRVYDKRGRFDETILVPITEKNVPTTPVSSPEGRDNTALRRIPINGGAITVSGRNVGASITVKTLGETIKADESGAFVLRRILPTGDHLVNIETANGDVLSRDFNIPAHDLFYIGLIDLTFGKSLSNDLERATGDTEYEDTFKRGRVAFYLKGKVRGGFLLTAAADTGEDDIGNLLKNFDEKNDRAYLDRIDPNEYYPVYGDDSTVEETVRTGGKLFVRLEREGNHVMWGNFKSEVSGTEYLRNERVLYGAQGVYKSRQQTSKGDAKVEAQAYAAQPDTLPQRDVFLGTGGSNYFLKYQDISRASETVLIEIQNPITGHVTGRRTLVYGVDYDLNYIQGVITLRVPLSAHASNADLIQSNPNGDYDAYLVVNYEHTPVSQEVDAFSYGGRIQTWITDELRLGLTAQNDELGTSGHKGIGVDLLYKVSEQTFLEAEIARTDGVEDSYNLSIDGGLTSETINGLGGQGHAFRLNGQVNLRDVGLITDGVISGYFENRQAGFSNLNYNTPHDERLFGFNANLEASEKLNLKFSMDDYENSVGKRSNVSMLTATYQKTDKITWALGAEYLNQTTRDTTEKSGDRLDLATKFTYTPNKHSQIYGYLQGTVSKSGDLASNNRIGFGGERQLNKNWRVSGEVSNGTEGIGGRLLVANNQKNGDETYIGYTLDPSRELAGVSLEGTDKGSFVAGRRVKVNDSLSLYAENTYDLFGVHNSLNNSYGVDYIVNDFHSIHGDLKFGHIDNGTDTQFDRVAFSLGSVYRDEKWAVRTRFEYRRDQGIEESESQDGNAIAATLSAKYKIDDEKRLILSAEGVRSENVDTAINDAKLVEVAFGYAYRPIDNDRLNVLAKYSYLYDMTTRETNETSTGRFAQPKQKAHVISVDASYDINNHWTVGAKIGGRWSKQAADTGEFTSNNATLGVLNFRYHVTHNWDALLEVRNLNSQDAGSQQGVLAAAYKHLGNNVKLGGGYNFGKFSSDLQDVTYDDKGIFLNIVAKF